MEPGVSGSLSFTPCSRGPCGSCFVVVHSSAGQSAHRQDVRRALLRAAPTRTPFNSPLRGAVSSLEDLVSSHLSGRPSGRSPPAPPSKLLLPAFRPQLPRVSAAVPELTHLPFPATTQTGPVLQGPRQVNGLIRVSRVFVSLDSCGGQQDTARPGTGGRRPCAGTAGSLCLCDCHLQLTRAPRGTVVPRVSSFLGSGRRNESYNGQGPTFLCLNVSSTKFDELRSS